MRWQAHRGTRCAACAEAKEAGYRVEIVFGDQDVDDLSGRAHELLDTGQVEGLLTFPPMLEAEERSRGVSLRSHWELSRVEAEDKR